MAIANSHNRTDVELNALLEILGEEGRRKLADVALHAKNTFNGDQNLHPKMEKLVRQHEEDQKKDTAEIIPPELQATSAAPGDPNALKQAMAQKEQHVQIENAPDKGRKPDVANSRELRAAAADAVREVVFAATGDRVAAWLAGEETFKSLEGKSFDQVEKRVTEIQGDTKKAAVEVIKDSPNQYAQSGKAMEEYRLQHVTGGQDVVGAIENLGGLKLSNAITKSKDQGLGA